MTREVRRQRQRATIERALAAREFARASALLAEHLIEFPEDRDFLEERSTVLGLEPEGTP